MKKVIAFLRTIGWMGMFCKSNLIKKRGREREGDIERKIREKVSEKHTKEFMDQTYYVIIVQYFFHPLSLSFTHTRSFSLYLLQHNILHPHSFHLWVKNNKSNSGFNILHKLFKEKIFLNQSYLSWFRLLTNNFSTRAIF